MAKMFFGLVRLPEWQGAKKTDARPCVIRRRGKDKAEIIPCTTKLHWDGSIFVGDLRKPSFAVMCERRVVPLTDVKVLNELTETTKDEILYWEFTNAVNLLSPKELEHCKTDLCFH